MGLVRWDPSPLNLIHHVLSIINRTLWKEYFVEVLIMLVSKPSALSELNVLNSGFQSCSDD